MSVLRRLRRASRRAALVPAAAVLVTVPLATTALAAPHHSGAPRLVPGDLLVATSTFRYVPGLVAGTTQLPPGCTPGSQANPCATAVTGGGFPEVFNNASVDGSFGVTSPITLEELSRQGRVVGRIQVPNSTERGYSAGDDQMVTSYSSKSELALHLSPNGRMLTFVGYDAPSSVLDVSNANTPGIDTATGPTVGGYYRVIGELGTDGRFHFTLSNAFSGDNGRAAIADTVDGATHLYMAGNANDGGVSNPEYAYSAGAQITSPSNQPESAQSPGLPTPVGSFGVSELGLSEGGNTAKENNYRGIAIENNVLYFTKGSGGKGINSVYFIDTTGKACPDGYGVPVPGAPLPTTALGNGSFSLDANGRLEPFNMCVLAGFPQILNSTNPVSDYPFGIWFANPHTLYVADEGNGTSPTTSGSYAAADGYNNPTAGIQKWVFDPAAQAWHLAYTLQAGLGLGVPYHVAGYPTGRNNLPGGTGAPWAPATDGIRQLTGRVNPNGTATLWATTSTVSGSGDQGADPNRLVEITDPVAALTPARAEHFRTVATARDGQVFRGVSFTPGTPRVAGSSS